MGYIVRCLVFVKEGLIKSTRAICERFCARMRRNFAGIIVFISRNCNKILVQNFGNAPQVYLISASLTQRKIFGVQA